MYELLAKFDAKNMNGSLTFSWSFTVSSASYSKASLSVVRIWSQWLWGLS